MIEFYNFSFFYPEGFGLKNINLKLNSGEFLLVAGRSGCGKTTLLRCINGLIPKYYKGEYIGEVIVDGLKVKDCNISDLPVATLFQNPDHQLFMFSVEREIAFGLENLGLNLKEMRERVEWALDFFKIKDLAKRAPYELSEGQKQRVALASLLVMKPKILLLDEPTSLLDPTTSLQLAQLLKELKGKLTIIVAEHKLELFASLADKILILQDGKIKAYGNIREVLKRNDLGISLPPLLELSLLLKIPPSFNLEEFLENLR